MVTLAEILSGNYLTASMLKGSRNSFYSVENNGVLKEKKEVLSSLSSWGIKWLDKILSFWFPCWLPSSAIKLVLTSVMRTSGCGVNATLCLGAGHTIISVLSLFWGFIGILDLRCSLGVKARQASQRDDPFEGIIVFFFFFILVFKIIHIVFYSKFLSSFRTFN